ncbi:hypothetical protein [Nocardia transvalensis]|uniref:hypothetical protein n=1 Tax=Nocardia transvalensis TaxID=37333 RepID=UPI0018938950|nr:hypothetical protein [Nocardia transvalensis]MBF6330836.1 hypothetical protein [Nocardia transvalensis]
MRFAQEQIEALDSAAAIAANYYAATGDLSAWRLVTDLADFRIVAINARAVEAV